MRYFGWWRPCEFYQTFQSIHDGGESQHHRVAGKARQQRQGFSVQLYKATTSDTTTLNIQHKVHKSPYLLQQHAKSEWVVLRRSQHTTSHFEHKTFQVITCTGTSKQKTKEVSNKNDQGIQNDTVSLYWQTQNEPNIVTLSSINRQENTQTQNPLSLNLIQKKGWLAPTDSRFKKPERLWVCHCCTPNNMLSKSHTDKFTDTSHNSL